MKLSELLEELQENLLRDHSEEALTDVSNLWSQRALVRYLDDAQNKMARETECLLDFTTPSVTHLQLIEGASAYQLDPRVIRIYYATYQDKDGTHVLKETSLYHELDGSAQRRSDMPSTAFQPDRVAFYSTDTDFDRIRIYPEPKAKQDGLVVQLAVSRLPLQPLVFENLEAEPEVPSDYHLDLVEWAAFRALRNHDVDGENVQKANAHRSAFRQALNSLRRATKRRTAPPAMFGGRAVN